VPAESNRRLQSELIIPRFSSQARSRKECVRRCACTLDSKERLFPNCRLSKTAASTPPLLSHGHRRTPLFQPLRRDSGDRESPTTLATNRRSLFHYVSLERRSSRTFAFAMGESEREIWLRFHPEPWGSEVESEYHKRFSGAIERWLDAGHGSCVLRRPDCTKIVAEAIRYFDGERLAMISTIVMPNHVHAVFVQNPEHPL